MKKTFLPLEIVIATGNKHKLKELSSLLQVKGVRFRSLKDFPKTPEVAETSRTFDGNAVKKAVSFAKATKCMVLADDSGLEVKALDGKPGVRSARFAGRHGDDQANNEKLLRLLGSQPLNKRTARYCCSLALASPTGMIALTNGDWKGFIAVAPKGKNGFGYDPIFWIRQFNKTVGQLPVSVKKKYSHRAVAAHRMQKVLKRFVQHLKEEEKKIRS